jgi:hypothetical protein
MSSRASFEKTVANGPTSPDDGYTKVADKRRGTQSPSHKAKTLLLYLLAVFLIILSVALSAGGGTRLAEALGWRRPNRVALLTVATHLSRLSESSDSESGMVSPPAFVAMSSISILLSCLVFYP